MNTCCENIQTFYGFDSKVYSVHVHGAQKCSEIIEKLLFQRSITN